MFNKKYTKLYSELYNLKYTCISDYLIRTICFYSTFHNV